MSYVTFKTNTLLPIEAITTFGVNSKPNTDSPIGYFGTGLKMAIATLVRNKIDIHISIGMRQFVFESRLLQFRDKEFTQVVMRRRDHPLMGWQKYTLPFTTELAKNWELWMAYRELEANTRDENGETYSNTDTHKAEEDRTLISVGPSTEFRDVYDHRDTVFLPDALRKPDYEIGANRIQVFRKPSKYLFYRGMRVMELRHPSIMTYNILREQTLTEDRTLKWQSIVDVELAEWMASLTDSSIINHFLNATSENWESTWDFDLIGTAPTQEFLLAIKQRKAAQAKKLQDEASTGHSIWASGRLSSYYDSRTRVNRKPPKEQMLWWHFQQWFEDVNIPKAPLTRAETQLFDAVLADLKESETEYTP